MSGQELTFTTAAGTRRQVHQARRRAALHGAVTLTVLAPGQLGFALAMEQPLRLFWMTLDDYVARSGPWLHEEQLDVLRTATTVPLRRT